LTQRGIKQVLTERYYSWREAEIIAQSDPEINLSGDGPLYVPAELEGEDALEEEEFEDAEAAEAEAGEVVEGQPEHQLQPEETTPEGKPESRPNA